MRNLALSLGCLILSSACLAQQGQNHVYTFNGDSADDRFGSVSGAGDVNQDGYADLIVGARLDDNNGKDSGSARVLSGKDGKILYTFHGDSAGDKFGWSVGGAGDVNKDGYADLVVGAPFDDHDNGTDSGSARVFSGEWIDSTFNKRIPKTKQILWTVDGDSAGDRLGWSVGGAGDVNKDGYADVIVGAVKDDNNGADSGSARVLSGNGTILYTFNGDSANDEFGHSVGGAGDVNKDGYADLIVGARSDDNNGVNSGSARVFSGKDGTSLHTFNGDSPRDFFGVSVAGAGDVNKDGFADVIVGANHDDNKGLSSGSARVFSGEWIDSTFKGRIPKTKQILYTFNGDTGSDQFGSSVGGAGDVNKDGYADLIVGARSDDNNGADSGSARVLSGKALTLATDIHAFSLAKANTQTLNLDAGPQNKGRLYWVFGSVTGTSPGVDLGSAIGPVTIPLNLDRWTDYTIGFANSPVLVNTKGTLDANGKAKAKITGGPVNVPRAVGLVFYHAYLVYDANNNFYMASNPVTLLLVK